MEIFSHIKNLVNIAIKNDYIKEADREYCINKAIALLNTQNFNKEVEAFQGSHLESLNFIVDYAVKNKIIQDTITHKDIFEAKIMDCFIPMPSVINSKFNSFENINEAMKWYENLSIFSNYIKTERIAKNIEFPEYDCQGNKFIMTLNNSKPEKSIEEIRLAAQETNVSYPKTVLSIDNVGFEGTITKQPRTNHRVIFETFNNEKWIFQFSPYKYFEGHSILISKKIRKMSIDLDTLKVMGEFIDKYNGMSISCNADLPIVGGSIQNHMHFQSGRQKFPIEQAQKELLKESKKVKTYLLEWPVSTLLVESEDRDKAIIEANEIIKLWKNFDIESKYLDSKFSTCSLHMTKENDKYNIYVILRNALTTEGRPDGLYHVPKILQVIKKENIGIIEVMGMAIFPGRLNDELKAIKNSNSEQWIKWKEWISNFVDFNDPNFTLKSTVITFNEILKEVGVFNKDQKIKEKFLEKINI